MYKRQEINDAVASTVVAQLLFLESEDPGKDIHMYINSPGGSVTAGMAIYDTMNYVKCDVSTTCIGMAASMGAFLLSSGAKGKRAGVFNFGAGGKAFSAYFKIRSKPQASEAMRLCCQNEK